jgi:hypothetical protein
MQVINYVVEHLLVPCIVQFFLVFGVIGVAVGVGLIWWNARTLRVLGMMNYWVSTRRWLKPVEIPHDTTATVQKYRLWIGIFFLVGAVYAMYGLVARFNIADVVPARGSGAWRPFIVWIVESLRWFLVASSILAAVVGVLLAFFPDRLRALEARANHWYSPRQAFGGSPDAMHMTLDKWVEAHPRVAGWIIAVSASAVVLGSALVLSRLK